MSNQNKNTRTTTTTIAEIAAIESHAKILIQHFLAKVTSISTVETTLVPLLTQYTLQVLNHHIHTTCNTSNNNYKLNKLSPALTNIIIHNISHEYQRQCSFASLAFLSPPAQSAWSSLYPLVLDYMHYISNDHTATQNLVRDCQLEQFLELVLDVDMRRVFHQSEFVSVQHVLTVCEDWRWELENIKLLSSSSSSANDDDDDDDDESSYDSYSNHCNDTNKNMEQALKDLRREIITVNGYRFQPPVKGGVKIFARALGDALVSPCGAETSDCEELMPKSAIGDGDVVKGLVPDDDQSSSEVDSSSYSYVTDCSDAGDNLECSNTTTNEKLRRRRRKKFDVSTVSGLTSRLIIAAGRTTPSGDAYFVVQDLFGGADVVVVPSSAPKMYNDFKDCRFGGIEVIVRLSCVVINVHSVYDIFPKDVTDYCDPLLRIYATTSETIFLQEVRASDDKVKAIENETSIVKNLTKLTLNEPEEDLCTVLKERITSSSGQRLLSLKPTSKQK